MQSRECEDEMLTACRNATNGRSATTIHGPRRPYVSLSSDLFCSSRLTKSQHQTCPRTCRLSLVVCLQALAECHPFHLHTWATGLQQACRHSLSLHQAARDHRLAAYPTHHREVCRLVCRLACHLADILLDRPDVRSGPIRIWEGTFTARMASRVLKWGCCR